METFQIKLLPIKILVVNFVFCYVGKRIGNDSDKEVEKDYQNEVLVNEP